MLKQGFISKIIEQIVQSIARMLTMDHEKEAEKFLHDFDETLQTYYKTKIQDLESLTQINPEKDVFLLDDKLRNMQLHLFGKAAWAFYHQDEMESAKTCLKIIERIQAEESAVFEFPSQKMLETQAWIDDLHSKLAQNSTTNH